MDHELISAVYTSLTVSITATVICFFVGTGLGCVIAFTQFKGKTILLNVLRTLLSVPTVIIGLFVFLLLSGESSLGSLHLLFTRTSIIIGQVILAMPIMIIFVHSAVSSVEQEAIDTAKTLGASPMMVNIAVLIEARFGIMAAIAATFGRLVGEVGVSMMLGGNIKGYTRTITTAIAMETSKGEFTLGIQLGVILLTIALSVNLFLQFLHGRVKKSFL